MLSQNSQTTFMVGLFRSYYLDMVTTLVPQSEATRDLQTVESRVATEGIGFFTKTLPRLGKAIDRSLSQGTCLQSSTGFKTWKGTKIPAFCRILLMQVFHSDGSPIFGISARRDGDGGASAAPGPMTQPSEQSEVPPDVNQRAQVVKILRTLCFMFYKLETPYTYDQEKKVIDDFIRADEELVEDYSSTDFKSRAILDTARCIIARVLSQADPYSGIPKHGPGSVATGEMNHQKHVFKRDYELLTKFFPLDAWFTAGPSHWADDFHQLQSLESQSIGTAKVVLVPKDSRGPRLISCEPLEYQWVQQSLMSTLVSTLENHWLTKGKVNFTDQTVNQRLALESSRFPYRFVTLDMKEASDRVSWNLVRTLFPENWVEALYACRTQSTTLPCGRVLPLNKFAPMGSAVCFPVEAFIFWALCVSVTINKHQVPLQKAATNTYVYGDDIIVLWEHHSAILNTLPEFELMFNSAKCCTAGPFKESCGMDAYEGFQVTPIRVKRPLVHPKSPDVLASYVSLSNRLHKAGLLVAAQYIFDFFQYHWRSSIPVFSDTATCIGFERPEWSRSELRKYGKRRWNKDHQRYDIRGYRLRSEEKSSDIEGWFLMFRLLTEMERKPDPAVVREDDIPGCWIQSNPRPTGTYPIAHRNKLMRAWTPAPQ